MAESRLLESDNSSQTKNRGRPRKADVKDIRISFIRRALGVE